MGLRMVVAGHGQGRRAGLAGGEFGHRRLSNGEAPTSLKMTVRGSSGGAETRRVRRGGRWAQAIASKGVEAAVSRRDATWA
jgi:hypothetical protein